MSQQKYNIGETVYIAGVYDNIFYCHISMVRYGSYQYYSGEGEEGVLLTGYEYQYRTIEGGKHWYSEKSFFKTTDEAIKSKLL